MGDPALPDSIVVGTAGHIDHGKSALVKALTGTDPDRLKEERERGITIDLGFAHCRIEALNVAFVDVPGHERFIRNMLAGVGGIDAVLLVVAADESVMPQTREHFEICRLLRIPAGVIALTKTDLADADMIELARMEVRELVAGSFLEQAPIVAVSAVTGSGLDDVRRALAGVVRRVAPRPAVGPVRLPIDRVFSMKGFGTVVTGTLVSGQLSVDDDLVLAPAGRGVKLRGLQVHGVKRPSAVAGQRVAVNLGGIEVEEVTRGDTLAAPGAFEPTRIIDAEIQTLRDARPLAHGARVRFHHGTTELIGRLSVARPPTAAQPHAEPSDAPNTPGGRRERTRSGEAPVPPGGMAFVRVRLEGPAVVTRGDRFILRAYSPPVTIAGGRVLDPQPPRGGIRTDAGRRRFERLAAGPAEDGLDPAHEIIVEESGAYGVPLRAFVTRTGAHPPNVPEIVRRLEASGRVLSPPGIAVSSAVVNALEERLLDLVGRYHQSQPLSEGMAREEIRERLFAHATPAVFEYVIERLTRTGRLAGRERLALGGHRVSLSADEERARALIDQTFREGGVRPPDAAGVAAALGLAPSVTERMIGLLVRQKVLVRLDTLLFHHEALQRVKSDLATLRNSAGAGQTEIDVATFKQQYGLTRKYAIPLLEYLDRERVTRRVGDRRVLAD